MLLVACTQPTEYVRDNPNDPTGTSFVLPSVSGLTSTRVERQIRLDWSTSFDRYTIHIERSVNGGAFALRDTLRSTDTTWVDTSVAMPDSNMYQYRVFGRYLDQSSDTITSYRITSEISPRPITHMDREFGSGPIRIHGWQHPVRQPFLSGDLLTHYMATDSTTLTVRYSDGSTIQRGLLEVPYFHIPTEETSRDFVLIQYSRGRVVSQWVSPTLELVYSIVPGFGNPISSPLLAGMPSVFLSSEFVDSQSFFLQSAGATSIRLYDARYRSSSTLLTGITEPIVSAIGSSTNRLVFSNESGAVFSLFPAFNILTQLSVPGPATTLGAHYASGELVYVRRHVGDPNTASIDRFNVTTQTLLASFPVSSNSFQRILDRPERNEIWIFDRGLRRINRTTGALIQDFDDSELVKYLMFQNGAAFATFRNQAPYVKRYDLATGQITTSTVPVPNDDLLYLADGAHIVILSQNKIALYRLSESRILAEVPYLVNHSDAFFLPVDTSDPDELHVVYKQGELSHLSYRWFFSNRFTQ